MPVDCLKLVPFNLAHFLLLDDFVITPLRSRVSLLITHKKLVDPLAAADSDLSWTNHPDWEPVLLRQRTIVHIVSKNHFIIRVHGILRWN